MIDALKKLIGPERLALLGKMPNVAERGGLDAFLQRACEGAASPAHALIIALQRAGSVPTKDDVAAAQEAEAAIALQAEAKAAKA